MNGKEQYWKLIRNFTIIAHVDHGKSTLSDKFLDICKVKRNDDQQLDNLEIEKERGITIKAQTARLNYKYNNNDYILNLVDTPGHVDFSYEVIRYLEGCENYILLVDAVQGVAAETLTKCRLAQKKNRFILPVINKIDLPEANIEKRLEEIDALGLDFTLTQQVSAKTGLGVQNLIEKIIELGLYPTIEEVGKALIIDSWYDKYFGIVVIVRVFGGQFKKGMKLQTTSTNFISGNVGVFTPSYEVRNDLKAGEIGFIITQIRVPKEIIIGDTISVVGTVVEPIKVPLAKPVVFCTFYNSETDLAIDALYKYQLNDSAFSFTIEQSELFGIYFNCGFLGLLHLEVVKERLKKEFDLDFMATLPSVQYKITLTSGEIIMITDASKWPANIQKIEEPEVFSTIFVHDMHIGKVSELCMSLRAEDLEIATGDQIAITCRLPLGEIIVDFAKKLYACTNGLVSFDYDVIGYRTSDLVRLLVIINDEVIEEFSMIVHTLKAKTIGGKLAAKLKEIIPRSNILIKIKISVNTPKNIIVGEEIRPYRKDVIAHCYGGDRSRKDKLLRQQAKGKKHMMAHTKLNISSNAFIELMQLD